MGMIFSSYLKNDIVYGLGVIAVASFSILMHEFGHALVSQRYGLAPRVELTGLGGLTYHAPARSNGQHLRITAAGPTMNFALAALLFAIEPLTSGMLSGILTTGMQVNIIWGLYNLLPIVPLDGGVLMQLLLRRWMRRSDQADRIAYRVSLSLGVIGALIGLKYGMLLVVFVLGLAAFENWRALQALGESPADHERIKHSNVRELLARARAAYAEADYDAAARFCHQARSEAFVSVDEMRQIWQVLALSAARRGEWADAVRFAERSPDSAEMAQVRAVSLVALRDPVAARAFLHAPAARLLSDTQLESLRTLARNT